MINLTNANFSGQNMSGGDFDDVDLTGANFDGANLTGADFRNACLLGASMRGANLDKVDFYEANLDYADLTDAHISDPNTWSASARYTKLVRATIDHGALAWLGLYGSLHGADLTGMFILVEESRADWDCFKDTPLVHNEAGEFGYWWSVDDKRFGHAALDLSDPAAARELTRGEYDALVRALPVMWPEVNQYDALVRALKACEFTRSQHDALMRVLENGEQRTMTSLKARFGLYHAHRFENQRF